MGLSTDWLWLRVAIDALYPAFMVDGDRVPPILRSFQDLALPFRLTIKAAVDYKAGRQEPALRHSINMRFECGSAIAYAPHAHITPIYWPCAIYFANLFAFIPLAVLAKGHNQLDALQPQRDWSHLVPLLLKLAMWVLAGHWLSRSSKQQPQ